MCFIAVLLFVKTITCENITNDVNIESRYAAKTFTIRDLADDLVNLLIAKNDNARTKELKGKLAKIDYYVTDREKVDNLLREVIYRTDMNKTNFFKDLYTDDNFKYLTVKEPKNLYLQMKEKMNRDDILKAFIDKGRESKLVKSARKVMGVDFFSKSGNEYFEDVVDKMIAEMPADDHKYNASGNGSVYWDPQGELEDLNEYHQHDGRRIFKGERTTIRYYPFMVSVHVMGRFWCGGAIYWHDLILTSAACLQLMHNNRFFRENPRVLQIRIGSNHSRIGGEVIDALEVYFHPAYNPRTLQNNIAVIRLRRHLFFNYHRIPKIIDISHNGKGIPATAEVMLLGWGVTKISQTLSYEPIYLQRKFLPVYPNTFCKEVYGDKFITSTMFCAGTITTGEGACDHDAGGPAILSGKLVGIISFGPTVCGFPNAPTVFTLVGAYADWIETINETMPDYYRGMKRTTTTTISPLFNYYATWTDPDDATETTGQQPIQQMETASEGSPPSPSTVSTTEKEETNTEAEGTTTETEETTTEADETTLTTKVQPHLLRGVRDDETDANEGWDLDLRK